MEQRQGGEGGLRRSSRIPVRTRRVGESQDFLDEPDVRDAAGLHPLHVGGIVQGGGGDDRERLNVRLHRQAGDIWAPGPARREVEAGGNIEEEDLAALLLQGADEVVAALDAADLKKGMVKKVGRGSIWQLL